MKKPKKPVKQFIGGKKISVKEARKKLNFAPTRPTAAQLAAEIALLRKYAPLIGGDNRVKIEAEITTLEEDLDEDEVCDRWAGCDSETSCGALEAISWARGKRREPTSKEWEPLLEKPVK